MDFDHAARRLRKEHAGIKSSRRGRPEISAQAKREADRRKQQQAKVLHERRRKQQQKEYLETYFQKCERALGCKQLSRSGQPLMLKPTSIHGDGDKIALPPSVLEFMTSTGNDIVSADSPWIFRIGIPRPQYEFPASAKLNELKMPQDDSEAMEESDYEEDDAMRQVMYLDELDEKYLSYTHGTVVEFTQDEDCVGLPQSIARRLLQGSADLIATRTKDPANDATTDGDDDDDEEEEKTPGHLAWGAFDVPADLVEVSMVRIPKGKACKLRPTATAIENGFYDLKDVKLVLEQSLIRTRATLSVGDFVASWHRGTQFELEVTEVTPAKYDCITCINTDIEVDFTAPEHVPTKEAESQLASPSGGHTLGSSQPPSSSSSSSSSSSKEKLASPTMANTLLRAEPPENQTEGVCTVQVRGNGFQAKRRFDVSAATLQDVFDFVATLAGREEMFRLVTRFPRRVFELNNSSKTQTMKEAGLQQGKELLLIEML